MPIPLSRMKLPWPRTGLLRAIGTLDSFGQHCAQLGQLVQPVPQLEPVQQVESQDQLFKRRIACPFAQSVAAAVHAFGTGCYGGKLCRHAHSEIVVGMYLDRQSRHALDPAHHVLDRLGRRTSHGVDDADRVGRRFRHDRIAEAGQVLRPCARRVIGEEHRMQSLFAGMVDHVAALLEHVLPGPAELRDQLRIADRHLDDDSVCAAFQSHVDVGLECAGKCVDPGIQAELRDFLDGFGILLRHRRHAGLDPVDADFVHLPGDADLVIDGEHDAGRLLAVSQGRVVYLDPLREFQVIADFRHEIVGADPPFAVFEMSFAHRFPPDIPGQSGQRRYTHISSDPKEKTTFLTAKPRRLPDQWAG